MSPRRPPVSSSHSAGTTSRRPRSSPAGRLSRCLRTASRRSTATVAFLGIVAAGGALPGAMAYDKQPETNGRTVTSWIPVTSAYASQPFCSGLMWSYVANTIAAWDPGYGITVDDSHSCHPKAVTTWWDAERLGRNTLTTISLGPFTCPQAYTTAKTSVKDASSTMVACCPAGYTFFDFKDPGDTGQCWSVLPAGKSITYADHNANFALSTTAFSSSTTVAGVHINGWIFAGAEAAGGAGSGSPTPSATGPVGAEGQPTGSVVSDSSSTATGGAGALSPAARVGIAVGATLGVIGLATLAAGVWMLRRARAGRKHDDRSGGDKSRPMADMAMASEGEGGAGGGGGGSGMGSPGGYVMDPRAAVAQRGGPVVGGGGVAAFSSGTYSPPPASYSASSSAPASYAAVPPPPPSSGGVGIGANTAYSGSSGQLSGLGMAAAGTGTGFQPQQQQHQQASELSGVSSPVLHPGDLQPQGYGPMGWKPGTMYG